MKQEQGQFVFTAPTFFHVSSRNRFRSQLNAACHCKNAKKKLQKRKKENTLSKHKNGLTDNNKKVIPSPWVSQSSIAVHTISGLWSSAVRVSNTQCFRHKRLSTFERGRFPQFLHLRWMFRRAGCSFGSSEPKLLSLGAGCVGSEREDDEQRDVFCFRRSGVFSTFLSVRIFKQRANPSKFKTSTGGVFEPLGTLGNVSASTFSSHCLLYHGATLLQCGPLSVTF